MHEPGFLQKFAKEVIKADKKILEEESREKTRGYHQCIIPPALSELHQRAVLEARRKKVEEFELEAIENELYLKEMKKNMLENKEQEEPVIKRRAALQELEEEAGENEAYGKEHPIEELKESWEEGYHEPEKLAIEEEVIENENYWKEHQKEYSDNEQEGYHPEDEEAEFYKSPIEQINKLYDYDKPRLYSEKPQSEQQKKYQTLKKESSQIEQSKKLYQIAPPPALPPPPLSRYTHLESTEAYPTQMLQKTKSGGFIRPVRKEEIPDTKAGLLKMKELIRDHAVTYINCPGPLKQVMIKRMGIPETLKISLEEAGIRQVIKEFSEASRIPYTEGLFKAIVGNLIITAVITEVGSRFTIARIIQ